MAARPAFLRTILLLCRKDLLRRRRAPLAVLVMLAFPLVFAGMLALAFGGDDENAALRTKILFEDDDDSIVGRLFLGALTSEGLEDLVEVVVVDDEGLEMMEAGEASALLRIPENATSQLLDDEAITIELVRNPTQGILPEIAEQISATLADVLSLLARFTNQELKSLGIDSLDSVDDLSDTDFAQLAVSVRHTLEAASKYVDGPPLELVVITLGEEDTEEVVDGAPETLQIFVFVLPGIAVYALFLIGDLMMRDILTENQAGTLRRQLSAPITALQVVTAKVLTAAVAAAAGIVILSGIVWGVAGTAADPAGFLALAAAVVLSATGFATVVYGLAKNDSQGSAVGAMIYLLLAFAGGAFLPLDNLPVALQSISPISPFYWGTRGFQDLLGDSATLVDVLPSVTMLGGLGLVLLLLGTSLLHRRLMRGAAE